MGPKKKAQGGKRGAEAGVAKNKRPPPTTGRVTRKRAPKAVSEPPIADSDKPDPEQEINPTTEPGRDPEVGPPVTEHAITVVAPVPNPRPKPFNMAPSALGNEPLPPESPWPQLVSEYREDEDGNIFFPGAASGLTPAPLPQPIPSTPVDDGLDDSQRYQRPLRTGRQRRTGRAANRGNRSGSRASARGRRTVRNHGSNQRRAESAPVDPVPIPESPTQDILESDPDNGDSNHNAGTDGARRNRDEDQNAMVTDADIPDLDLDVQFSPPSPFPEGALKSPSPVRKKGPRSRYQKPQVNPETESESEIEDEEEPERPRRARQKELPPLLPTDIPGFVKPKPKPIPKPTDIVPSTTFAGPYRSSFSTFLSDNRHRPKLRMLKHANCSYLSTPGVAPSLEELKQHAQALAVLIRSVCFNTKGGVVDYELDQETSQAEALTEEEDDDNFEEGNGRDLDENQNERWNGFQGFLPSEAFDWLTDLGQPYESRRATHKLPLIALANQLSASLSTPTQEEKEKHHQDICPLYPSHPEQVDKLQPQYPYATLANLVVHADICLTRLDHELSATGGLLSLLPTEGPEKEAADKTMLGKWIHFTRLLVARCHELEKSLVVALQTLANEAVVPRERLGDASTSDRVQRVKKDGWVHMQDKFILSGYTHNLRQGVLDALQRRLDDATVVGEGEPRGVVWCHLRTKYVQLRGGKTIFIVPDWEDDGTEESLEEELLKENRPTVVQVVKPEYRIQPSVWESRFKGEINRMRDFESENETLRQRVDQLEKDKKLSEMGLDIDVKKDKEWIVKRMDNLWELERKLGKERSSMKNEVAREVMSDLEKRKAELDERERKILERENSKETNIFEALRKQEQALRQEFQDRLQQEITAWMSRPIPQQPRGPTLGEASIAPSRTLYSSTPSSSVSSRSKRRPQDPSPYIGPTDILRPQENQDEDMYSENEDVDY